MKKIIALETKKEHYKGAPCIVWCFDDRFHQLLIKLRQLLKKEAKILHIDIVKVAGGARDLASPDSGEKRQTLLWEIETSLKLHKAPWLGLMTHTDCSAYRKTFESEKEESDFYESELGKAKKVVKSAGINIPVKMYYADFKGLYEIVENTTTATA